MSKNNTVKKLSVETDTTIYEIELGQIQIAITGRCNMDCQHCRAANEIGEDMPIEQIVKIIRFGKRYSQAYKEVVISGGEPFAHKEFESVIKEVRKNGVESLTITTNGTLVTEKHLQLFKELAFRKLTFSVSLDSLDPLAHNEFRRHKNAYDLAIQAVKMIQKEKADNWITSLRMTLKPSMIDEMDDMIQFAKSFGVERVGFSSIHPSGAAISRPDFWMTKAQKKQFLENIFVLRKKYPLPFRIETNDPLKCIVRSDDCTEESSDRDDSIKFGGCGAAAVTFNVCANGDMTPCALMDLPMMNVFNLSIDEMAENYRKNEIVKNMLKMNLKGKCGTCKIKYSCGGCRARALGINGDYLGEDPDCWLDN
ncbi:MAG: hypothetical protein CVV41_22405 [Candidatus Riflebacteria bacterium HGW-Riflebacteria-1]|jgi:radical SAM protein with 4Fe4S-binding SPASM domain|nr:MAG: hypothetical protein CVV41_22405 [Candidatus Riflebacteria bacterium HGW-Riflebacteria-1]